MTTLPTFTVEHTSASTMIPDKTELAGGAWECTLVCPTDLSGVLYRQCWVEEHKHKPTNTVKSIPVELHGRDDEGDEHTDDDQHSRVCFCKGHKCGYRGSRDVRLGVSGSKGSREVLRPSLFVSSTSSLTSSSKSFPYLALIASASSG